MERGLIRDLRVYLVAAALGTLSGGFASAQDNQPQGPQLPKAALSTSSGAASAPAPRPRELTLPKRGVLRSATIVGRSGDPIELEALSESDRQQVLRSLGAGMSPSEIDQHRAYVADLYQLGGISQGTWEYTAGRQCMYGPAPAPVGVTEDKLKRIVDQNRNLPARDLWKLVMSLPPETPTTAEPRPLIVRLGAPDGPNCVGLSER